MHLFVEGRVQGVWFRETAYHLATAHDVSGWVRNLPDGRVEVVYEGPPDAVDELVTWTHRGPDRALVTLVEIHDETPQGERGFNVR
jgi:acylphosphatase